MFIKRKHDYFRDALFKVKDYEKKRVNNDFVQARQSASVHLHHLFEGHLQLHRLQGGGPAPNSHILQ